jgi:hypothetical protein
MRADEGKVLGGGWCLKSIKLKPVALRCHSLGVLAFFVDGMKPPCLISPEEMGPSCTIEPWEEFKDLNFCITTQDN